MQRNIDIGLGALSRELLTMAGYVEQAIEAATQGWQKRSAAKIQEVYAVEQKVNQSHLLVDDQSFKILALQQPMAADLRKIVAIIKINSDLERMADLTVNIANNTEYFLQSDPLFDLKDLSVMANEARMMVKEVLDAFIRTDQVKAREVLLRDDTVDALKRGIVDSTIATMKANPKTITQGLNLILMAKNLERIGDHATNIAEDVIFMASGEDVRHGSQNPSRGGK